MLNSTAIAVSTLAAAMALSGAAAAPKSAPSNPHMGYGVDMKTEKAALHRAMANGKMMAKSAQDGSAIPATSDLSQYALPSGEQGQVNSCTTWATGYSAYGILMRKQGIDGAPMAPMFVYAQIVKGQNLGTSPTDVLNIEQKQGIDTKSDYTPGDFDYTTQPTDAQRQNATHYKLSGYDYIEPGNGAREKIESAVSQGQPVVMSVYVRASFGKLDPDSAADYSYLPGDDSTDPVNGSHEITIVGYNDKGVRIQNSWGTAWGDNGFANVPWQWVESNDALDFHVLHDLTNS